MTDTRAIDGIDKSEPEVRAEIARRFHDRIPHIAALGLEIVDVSGPTIVVELPFREDFVGDPMAGLWHTAVGTSAADSACGLAVFLALPGLETVATLDLRMDYLRPARAGQSLVVEAECHHITRCVAFVRATLHQNTPDRPTALCHAAFMRTGRSVRP
ncbi:PaaI family thioesterase [Salinisphaera sp. T31B1]|uniref:PaaI family thioesterase n=1 Tax=Salinisphaera sp. T31B1 TaxID=727963 RepID=UPI0033425150